jgi:hypothetical protein
MLIQHKVAKEGLPVVLSQSNRYALKPLLELGAIPAGAKLSSAANSPRRGYPGRVPGRHFLSSRNAIARFVGSAGGRVDTSVYRAAKTSLSASWSG